MKNDAVSFEEYLARYGSMTYTNVGISMLPLLHQGKDLFTVVRKTDERCKVGDVVLYRRDTQYVLHRIVEVRDKEYVILGDNCINREYGVTDHDIIGILTHYKRNGKEHSTADFEFRLYTAFWLRTEKLRVFLKRGCLWVKNHFLTAKR